MHKDIKIIALDLDGTLLDSRKNLSPRNLEALKKAADHGIEIVPTTGRFFGAMPKVIQDLPFLNYAITINGAEVLDIRRQTAISKAEIPMVQAIKIMEYLDTLPVIYDCYMDNWGWMTKSLQDRAEEFVVDLHYLKMVRELRQPVEDLKAFVAEKGHDVQKIQLFTRDMDLRAKLLRVLETIFKDTAISSSISNNIEINHIQANKGEALSSLAAHLGCSVAQTMAFGDGLNDLSMIEMAGVGIVMENGLPEVKGKADYITASCDENGVALGIERFCF